MSTQDLLFANADWTIALHLSYTQLLLCIHTPLPRCPTLSSPKRSLVRRQLRAQLIPKHLPSHEQTISNLHKTQINPAHLRTLSQSNFDLVIGNALLNPLNVFSPISWYTSPNDSWYFDSSVSISARTFVAELEADAAVMAGGRAREIVCVVSSWTWRVILSEWEEGRSREVRHTLPCS